ncbi:MAG: SDR family oxidoreductase [Pseudomonadota bacterium]|nr:SDR family oxidoreductase [Pseudomonadota bacterium]
MQTAHSTFSATDLEACLQVLRAVHADRGLLAGLTPQQRRDLLMLSGLVSRPDRGEMRALSKAFRRAGREARQQQDHQSLESAGLRIQRRSETWSPLWLPPPPEEDDTTAPRLGTARACYICKQPYTEVHRFYDSMCRPCGDFNYAKRSQTTDLAGRVALVTGARVKIGYQAALMLLRAGAQVVALTRFPVDAAARYAEEPDYASFRDRLRIHGLDLRHTPSVEIFARWLGEQLPRLDFILNNACQTVRRPAGFFRHLLEREAAGPVTLPTPQRAPLAAHAALCRELLASSGSGPAAGRQLAQVPHGFPDGLVNSAALSQRRYLDEDYLEGEALFPSGRYDEDRQQVDLREMNSWRLRLHEVQTPELLEVQLVNAVAPYILNARLKPLMMRSGARDLHIVNVSAMEGQFYRTMKTDKHPHTNMAKAALNMMTRTSAPDYVRDGIHMNAVDTGWITDEDPAVHAARKAEAGFAPPLDIIDGAARIVDPLFSGLNTGTHLWGQFLKDYKPAPW